MDTGKVVFLDLGIDLTRELVYKVLSLRISVASYLLGGCVASGALLLEMDLLE